MRNLRYKVGEKINEDYHRKQERYRSAPALGQSLDRTKRFCEGIVCGCGFAAGADYLADFDISAVNLEAYIGITVCGLALRIGAFVSDKIIFDKDVTNLERKRKQNPNK